MREPDAHRCRELADAICVRKRRSTLMARLKIKQFLIDEPEPIDKREQLAVRV